MTAAVFGWPAWRSSLALRHRARQAAREKSQADSLNKLAEAVSKVLFGTTDPSAMPDRSPDHPSVVDMLEEIHANQADVALVTAALAWHLADQHGPYLPRDLARKLAEARTRNL